MKARDKIRRGFDHVYDHHPYFAAMISALQVVEIRSLVITTAATDGVHLYYNSDFIDKMSIRDVQEIILHEAGHLFLGHHFRFGQIPAQEWNLAADLALNYYIKEYCDPTGIVMRLGCVPEVGRFRDVEAGRSAEWYYEQLKDLLQKIAEEMKGQEGQGQGQGQGQGTPVSVGEVMPHPSISGKAEGEGDRQGQTSQAQSTTPGSESSQSGEDNRSDAQKKKNVAQAKEEWEDRVATGVMTSKNCGNLPGWVKEVSRVETEAKIDVESLLKQFMTRYAPTRTSYSRPNRRSVYRSDVILPSLRARELGEGMVLVDTSGSMDSSDCQVAITFIERALQIFPDCKVRMRQADTRTIVGADRTFSRFDFPMQIPLEWQGRGGTDLSPSIAEIAKEGNYEWLIIVTDMEWSVSQAVDPKIPTLWLTTEEIHGARRTPTFGQVVGPVQKEMIRR